MKFEFQNNGLTLSWLGKKRDRIHCSFLFLILTYLFLDLQYFFSFLFEDKLRKSFMIKQFITPTFLL